MRRMIDHGSVVALVALGAFSAVACTASEGARSGAPASSSKPEDQTGAIGARLQIGGGVVLTSVSYRISGAGGFARNGSVDLSQASELAFQVGGLPSGAGYTITLTATATDGSTTCAGSATFSVVAAQTTGVTINLDCHEAPSLGAVSVNGVANICPIVDGITAIPSSVPVGGTIALAGIAHDPDSAPSALSDAWTASSGTLSGATTADPTFTCTVPGAVSLGLTVSDGDTTPGCPATMVVTVTCTGASDGGVGDGAATDATTEAATGDAGGGVEGGVDGGTDAAIGADASAPLDGAPAADASDAEASVQTLVTSVDPGVQATQALINQGTAIGEGALNGATPSTLTNLAADPNNTQSITASGGDFFATGQVPDTAAGFCSYPTDGGAATRNSYVTGAKFETAGPDGGTSDPLVPMAPFYFPMVYTTVNTPTGNAFGGQPPMIGLFDWRPKDIDEALVVAESDDFGKTWYFMQTVLELFPDYSNPISGGYAPGSTNTGCPATITSTNANTASANGSNADDGWGHATVLQLPGPGNVKTGQFLYMLDRNTNDIPGTSQSVVDNAPLHAINLTGSTNKFPIWNTNNTLPGANDIKSIGSALHNTSDGGTNAIAVNDTVGLLNPDGIMAVFPTGPAAPAGSPVTVLYVQKILGGDDTGPTALPITEQCTKAPFSGKSNHDISNVRLAQTTDGVHFTDLGIVQGLSDPTTVDYNKTRWISPRGTLLDINGDGSRWGLYFSGGNCLDGDSDAFHYIGYAESSDTVHWTVYNDINSPIASINRITTTNQATGATVTVPANAPLVATQAWFAERLYAPTATRIDATHLSMTFAGYGVQTPNNDLLDYRQIGNVVLTVSKPLALGVPNNSNAH